MHDARIVLLINSVIQALVICTSTSLQAWQMMYQQITLKVFAVLWITIHYLNFIFTFVEENESS